MNRKPLPYPPQMRNGGLPPAHLPTSPHSNPVATIVSDLKAIVSNAIAASAEKAARCQEFLNKQAARTPHEAAAARAHQEAACRQQLLNKQAARTRQEAAAARARQEAARQEASQVISLWLC